MATVSIEQLFGDGVLTWGRKHPRGTPLTEVWRRDPDYLIWSANLVDGRPADLNLPPAVKYQISVALLILRGRSAEAEAEFARYKQWHDLSQAGIGLSELKRPTRDECKTAIGRATLLGGHSDLDGIFSLALLLSAGDALGYSREKPRGDRIRLLGYGIRSREDYDAALGIPSGDRTGRDEDKSIVIVDFAAHPQAALNLDHHATTLSFWEPGTPIPVGIYETTMPSCPRLLSTFCGLEAPSEMLSGCDMIDGALYTSIEDTVDLKNPFVALNYCFSIEVSDAVLRQAVFTLADHQLDPESLLSQPIWKARLKLVELEIEEQRGYWKLKNRIRADHPFAAIADGRGAPYSTTNLRYMPLEVESAAERPYLITIRPPNMFNKINVAISRNPFYSKPDLFDSHPLNLGALARTLGQGGGRIEAASLTVPAVDLSETINKILLSIERSQSPGPANG